MRLLAVVMSVAVVAGGAVWAQTQRTTPEPKTAPALAPVSTAVDKGARWLASVQGADGGWGQDGGAASSARPGERLESSGNDVANTAVAALALLQAGRQYRAAGGARTRICPAADRGESSRRPGNHRSPGHADPAKAGPVHRHVSLVDADVAD